MTKGTTERNSPSLSSSVDHSTPIRKKPVPKNKRKRTNEESSDININKINQDHNSSFEEYVPKRRKPSELNKEGRHTSACLICKDILDGCEEEIMCCGVKFHTTCIRYFFLVKSSLLMKILY